MSESSARRRRKRDWTELPENVTAAILSRLGAIKILETAQKVCTKWRKVFKDPRMWRKIDMQNGGHALHRNKFDMMCRHAVDQSSGNLVDINIEYFGTDELLEYITRSSTGIKRLRLFCCDSISDEGLSKVASKLSLLEELDITLCANISHESNVAEKLPIHEHYRSALCANISSEVLKVVGRSCPLLQSFKFNKEWRHFSEDDEEGYDFSNYYAVLYKNFGNVDALAIAGTMHGLRHLQLFGNRLKDDGLRNILECCPHLESLDLRHCFNLNMGERLRRVCNERIKKLCLPHDSTEGKEFTARSEGYCFRWTELPDDITVMILSRLGGIDILSSAQRVCSKWLKIFKDPKMWRQWCTIDMRNKLDLDTYKPFYFRFLCETAIARSCGNLVDINIENFGTNELLKFHLAESSSRLKRLRLVQSHRITDEGFREVASKFPLLEDLDISICEDISHETIALIGRSCPLLKSFKFNNQWKEEELGITINRTRRDVAIAIAKTMPGLHHLMLLGNHLTNGGLNAILDGCPHLESLDLRQCFSLRLGGKLGRRCAERIKKLRLPNDSVADLDPSYGFTF